VLLVLRVIVVVVTPMLRQGVGVDMAITNKPRVVQDADKADALLVAITRDGKIFFGSELMAGPEALTAKVKDRVAARTDKAVYVKADARAKYGKVVEVVDNVRSAGVDQLGLLTEQRKSNNPTDKNLNPGQ